MASRKYHLLTAIIVFFLYLILYYLVNSFTVNNLPAISPLWVVTAFFLTLIGSEAPDWDLLLNWLQHRDITTHSIFIPLIISGAFIMQTIFNPEDPTQIFAIIFSPFMLGFGSHLLLDLFPNIDPEKGLKEGGITHTTALLLKGFVSGLTGLETVKALQGTYLIHLPLKTKVRSEKKGKKWEVRKTLPLKASRWWLFFNGILSGLMGIMLLVIYQLS
ncbi:MAG: metal-dependent hydrolase [Candidatus Hodarchaeales archaeon]